MPSRCVALRQGRHPALLAVILCVVSGSASPTGDGDAACPTGVEGVERAPGPGEQEGARAAALRAWRQSLAPDGVVAVREDARKMLIVDNTFGGLSNRRQSLMLAAAAAKLMR